MKVDFGTKFFDLKGEQLVGPGVPEHLGEAAANALVYPSPNDHDFAGKAKKFELAMRVVSGGVVEVSVEEAVTIKSALGILYSGLICGPAERALNGLQPLKG